MLGRVPVIQGKPQLLVCGGAFSEGRSSFRDNLTAMEGPVSLIRLVTWFLPWAAALLVGCAQPPPAPLFGGPNGPPDELVMQECRGEVAKAQVSGNAPADVRAELAQGVMASCMAKKCFYLQ
jgi:hypothetical protein